MRRGSRSWTLGIGSIGWLTAGGLGVFVLLAIVNLLHIAEVNELLRQDLQSAQRRIRVLEADLEATLKMVRR